MFGDAGGSAASVGCVGGPEGYGIRTMCLNGISTTCVVWCSLIKTGWLNISHSTNYARLTKHPPFHHKYS